MTSFTIPALGQMDSRLRGNDGQRHVANFCDSGAGQMDSRLRGNDDQRHVANF